MPPFPAGSVIVTDSEKLRVEILSGPLAPTLAALIQGLVRVPPSPVPPDFVYGLDPVVLPLTAEAAKDLTVPVAANDDHIARVLNDASLGSAVPGSVPMLTFTKWAGSSGVRAKLKAGQAHTNPAIAAVCDTAISMLSQLDIEFDPTDTYTAQMMDALLAVGVITADDVAGVLALCSQLRSRAHIVLGRPVRAEDVSVALGRS